MLVGVRLASNPALVHSSPTLTTPLGYGDVVSACSSALIMATLGCLQPILRLLIACVTLDNCVRALIAVLEASPQQLIASLFKMGTCLLAVAGTLALDFDLVIDFDSMCWRVLAWHVRA